MFGECKSVLAFLFWSFFPFNFDRISWNSARKPYSIWHKRNMSNNNMFQIGFIKVSIANTVKLIIMYIREEHV